MSDLPDIAELKEYAAEAVRSDSARCCWDRGRVEPEEVVALCDEIERLTAALAEYEKPRGGVEDDEALNAVSFGVANAEAQRKASRYIHMLEAGVERLTAIVDDVTKCPQAYIHDTECSKQAGPRRDCPYCRDKPNPVDVLVTAGENETEGEDA